VSKIQNACRSLVSRLVSNLVVFDLAVGGMIVLAFVLYQEAPPGTWTQIRRIIGRW